MSINKTTIIAKIFVILQLLIYFMISNVYAYSDNNTEFINDSNLHTLSSDKKEEEEKINLDEEIENCTNVKYIENSDYFKVNPKHSKNYGDKNAAGECTTVAMQLLMGYHNYYSDGRLIPVFKNEETRFLSENYGSIEDNPIINNTRSPKYGRESIGTEDEFFNEIFDLTPISNVIGIGQMVGVVRIGAERFVDKYASEISENVYIDDGIFSEEQAKTDIDNNIPIVLGMNPIFSEANSFHVVVAYGYATIDDVDGFIVHYGWQGDLSHVWIPSSWFGFQIRMSVEHEHTYMDSEVNVINQYRKLICSTCGCTTVDKLYDIDEESFTLVNLKYNLSGEIYIPNIIYDVEIKSIGNNIFENQSNITSVSISNSIEIIGERAFANCINLEKIELSNELTYIGRSAFLGCDSILNLTIPDTVTYIGENAFENCVSLKNISLSENLNVIEVYTFKNCKSIESITISKNVMYILNKSFENCENLKSVYIEKTKGDAIYISSDVFDGCTLLEDIAVPSNKYLEYINSLYWNEYEYYLICDKQYEELFIDCKTDISFEKALDNKDNEVYKVKVDCAKSYTISVTGMNDVFIKLYNQSLSLMDIDFILSNGNYTGSIVVYLSKGTYYLSVGYADSNSVGKLSINIEVTWPSSRQQVFYSYDIYRNNILDHLHNVTDTLSQTEVYYINNSSDFYRFTLTGITNLGVTISYPSSQVIIKDHLNENVINKFYYEGYSNLAESQSNYNPNSLVAYLEDEGYYYIHVSVPEDDLIALYLDIESIDYQEMDVFDRLGNPLIWPLASVNIAGDYVKELHFVQNAKYEINVSCIGTLSNDVLFIFVKLNEDDTFSSIATFLINNENKNYQSEFIIEKGTYYMGYFNKGRAGTINVRFTLICEELTNVITSDQYGMLCGSQINIIEKEYSADEKSYGGTEVIKGFTRIVYLNSDAIDSNRSSYDWYSSDENIASISSFGTLLGKKEGIVTIIAIYKEDPKIIYYKQFNIIDNTIEGAKYYIHIYDVFDLLDEKYKLPLNSENCPYPMIQYYDWSIEVISGYVETIGINLDNWGNLTACNTGYIDIIGEYTLNDNYVIIIHLNIICK